MRITGNRGEWSELYALIKLMYTGRLYAADENVNRLDDVYFPIIRILRNHATPEQTDYIIHEDTVDVILAGDKVSSIDKVELAKITRLIYSGILAGSDRAFEIPGAPKIMEEMHIDRISAASSDKTDITMQIHDIYTGYNPICGFSIKSELGSAPTLLNASGATNFVYEVRGITDDDMERINAIDTKTKILDRIADIMAHGELKFIRVANDNFSSNLMLIDSYMDSIIAEMLLAFYQNKATDCKSLVDLVEDKNIKNQDLLVKWLKDLSKICRVFISLGNHDFYYNHKPEDTYDKELFNEIDSLKNVYVLDNRVHRKRKFRIFYE